MDKVLSTKNHFAFLLAALALQLFSPDLTWAQSTFSQPVQSAPADNVHSSNLAHPFRLIIRRAASHSIRITLLPVDGHRPLSTEPFSPALVARHYAGAAVDITNPSAPVHRRIGPMIVDITPKPLSIRVTSPDGYLIQRLVFRDDSSLTFVTGDAPILGLGEGGLRPDAGTDWRRAPVEYNRLGHFYPMQPRWQNGAYGSRNPVPLLIGTAGWALFIATPWGQIDLSPAGYGIFSPWRPAKTDSIPQTEKDQNQQRGKGLPPADSVVAGQFDLFVFDARHPSDLMKDISELTGPAVMPPKWALGYMQSHRTIRDEIQILGIVDSFRSRRIPIDAVIYLGTGFTPRGWNTRQPSFDFNPEVFHRDPAAVLADFHALHVKVVLHMVPWDRDRLPTLHGNIPPGAGEILDAGHIDEYWKEHVPLMKAGVDAFWPDEGDWFNLDERMKRHQLYYQGPLSIFPNTRPWSLHRNGYLGVARWGGWIWSGDTESSWKTLEAQIAVGINHSLSLSPYWGSDIGGFYPSAEKTGELYARWFQFGAFCPSFRCHGRTSMTILPWGWGQPDRGFLETPTLYSSDSERIRQNVLESEMNNPLIEQVVKKYDELRYRLLPYNYTLAWEARSTGMPLMRALWLEYPRDTVARSTANEYLWGPDLLIAPVFEKGATTRRVYLPAGQWYDWWTLARRRGGGFIRKPVDLSVMPIFVKAGAIIPLDPVRQYTAEPVTAPTTLEIFPGADGDFTLYEDDGISEAYLRNKATWIRLTWNDAGKTLTLSPGCPGTMPIYQHFTVRIMTGQGQSSIIYSGKTMTVRL